MECTTKHLELTHQKSISPSKSRIVPSRTWISTARIGSWLSKKCDVIDHQEFSHVTAKLDDFSNTFSPATGFLKTPLTARFCWGSHQSQRAAHIQDSMAMSPCQNSPWHQKFAGKWIFILKNGIEWYSKWSIPHKPINLAKKIKTSSGWTEGEEYWIQPTFAGIARCSVVVSTDFRGKSTWCPVPNHVTCLEDRLR